ncbi:hypothetical protein LLH23_23060 [bacterium]|nr:hypothetical protein [bacterium]
MRMSEFRFRRVVLPLSCLLMLSGLHAAEVPTTARYARLSLPPTGAETLLVKLRSDGACKLRNVLFADVNANGQFEPREKSVGKVTEMGSGQFASCVLPAVAVPFRRGGDCAGRNVVTVHVTRYQRRGQPVEEYCGAMVRCELQRGTERWVYYGACRMTTARSVENLPPGGWVRGPQLEVATAPDEATKGQTGIGVTLAGSEFFVSQATHNGQPCLVTVKVTTADGKVVHQGSAGLAKMAFG